MSPYDIEVLTPDQFLVQQFHLNEDLLIEKLVSQAGAREIHLSALLVALARRAPSFSRAVGDRL